MQVISGQISPTPSRSTPTAQFWWSFIRFYCLLMIILTVSSHLHAGEITLSFSLSLALSLWQISAYADKDSRDSLALSPFMSLMRITDRNESNHLVSFICEGSEWLCGQRMCVSGFILSKSCVCVHKTQRADILGRRSLLRQSITFVLSRIFI